MNVLILPEAAKAILRFPRKDAERIYQAIQQVADAHPARLAFVTELAGRPNEWRLRKGDYRVLFQIEGGTMTVFGAGARKEIYR